MGYVGLKAADFPGEIAWFRNPSEKLRLDEIPLEAICYGYAAGKLVAVQIDFRILHGRDTLAVLAAAWGSPSQRLTATVSWPPSLEGEWREAYWDGQRVLAMHAENGFFEHVVLVDRQFFDGVKQRVAEQARTAAKTDF